MAITFNQVPTNALVPFTYVEIDPARAGSGGAGFQSLLIGQRLAAGTVAAGVPVPVGGAVQARSLFGAGSMLALMCEAFRRQNPIGQLWGVALADAAGGVAGTTMITVTSAATGAGTIALYIAGRRVPVGIASGAATTAIATAIDTAVKAAGGGTTGVLPVTSSVAASVVTLTNRNAGAAIPAHRRSHRSRHSCKRSCGARLHFVRHCLAQCAPHRRPLKRRGGSDPPGSAGVDLPDLPYSMNRLFDPPGGPWVSHPTHR